METDRSTVDVSSPKGPEEHCQQAVLSLPSLLLEDSLVHECILRACEILRLMYFRLQHTGCFMPKVWEVGFHAPLCQDEHFHGVKVSAKDKHCDLTDSWPRCSTPKKCHSPLQPSSVVQLQEGQCSQYCRCRNALCNFPSHLPFLEVIATHSIAVMVQNSCNGEPHNYTTGPVRDPNISSAPLVCMSVP